MVILGGAGVFWGPALGAGLVIFVEYFASLIVPARWPLVLGLVFILSVMLSSWGN